MPLAGFLFGFFFLGCIAQFFVLSRVEAVLKRRHPEVWQEIEDNALFTSRAVSRFIVGRHDRRLKDAALSRTVSRTAWFYRIMIAIWALFALSLFAGFGHVRVDVSQWLPNIH